MARGQPSEESALVECIESFVVNDLGGGHAGDVLVRQGDLSRTDDPLVQRLPGYYVGHPSTAAEIRRRQRDLRSPSI